MNAVGVTACECIQIAPHMTALIGCAWRAEAAAPADPIAVIIAFDHAGRPAALHVEARPDPATFAEAGPDRFRLVFLVARAAILGLGGAVMTEKPRQAFHLCSELRAIALAVRDAPATPETRTAYRGAKSIELICQTIRLLRASELVPMNCGGGLSVADTRRIMTARRIIDERSAEKLTLEGIARDCGLNRTKLTRGFRQAFDCTVGEAIAERRLHEAGRLLLTTDLLVSSIGYEAGYLNNASFARAFSRHFGRSPSEYRAGKVAA